MSKDSWYRKTSWSPADAKDFFARLARARGEHTRPQYLRIQALTLEGAGYFREALDLLEMAIDKFPNCFDITLIRQHKAKCLLALGVRDQALTAFRSAIESQHAQPNVQSHVALDFAEAYYDADDGEHRDELVELLKLEVAKLGSFGFPAYEFRYSVMFARLLSARGDIEEAARWARRALSAQRAENSGFRYHQSLGLVSGVAEQTEIWLRRLAALADPP